MANPAPTKPNGAPQAQPQGKRAIQQPEIPEAISVKQLLAMNVPKPEMLIEGLIPTPGVSLVVGQPKSGKTILTVGQAIAVATGRALFDHYRVKQGPTMIVEQDDPAGAAGLKDIIVRANVEPGAPLCIQPRLPFTFGEAFLKWLAAEIVKRSLVFVVLDSYTALRGSRGAGVDIVKAEQNELQRLDQLAKEHHCAIVVIHHSSKGSAALDWSEKAAGTFAMAAATEAQIFISRFPDLDSASGERLVRMRGRHCTDMEMVLRFRPDTLDYEHILEGSAASLYPAVVQIRDHFGNRIFTPKELCHETGASRATAFRQIDRLYRAGALEKRGHGEYALADLR